MTAIWMLVVGAAALVSSSPPPGDADSSWSASARASSQASSVPETATTRSLGRTSNVPSPAWARLSTLVAEAITTDAASMPGIDVTCAETVIKDTESL